MKRFTWSEQERLRQLTEEKETIEAQQKVYEYFTQKDRVYRENNNVSISKH